MGLDLDIFVHPERISSQLICPICTVVLHNPVQTPSEHLFCEDELLEWMTQSNLNPATQEPLDPSTIRKPVNMLNELEVYCPNRSSGCQWTGQYCNLSAHCKSCIMKTREELVDECNCKDEIIKALRHDLKLAERANRKYESRIEQLEFSLQACEVKLKVYDAFFRDEGSFSSREETALEKVARLRRLQTFQESENSFDTDNATYGRK